MCIRDRSSSPGEVLRISGAGLEVGTADGAVLLSGFITMDAVSYTHLRAHETVLDLVCRLLLEKKK